MNLNQVTIMIAESDEAYRDMLASSLKAQDGIKVVSVAEDGTQALKQIEELRPQVVICNMVLPRMDGFALLEAVGAMDKELRPRMIALSALGRDDFITRAEKLGVDEYLIKPVDMDALVERIWRVAQRKPLPEGTAGRSVYSSAPYAYSEQRVADLSDTALTRCIAALLLQMGIPAHLSGYSFLLQAVLIELRRSGAIHNITSEIYPVVAQTYHTTASRVERSIRHAVNVTWDRGGGEVYARIMRRATSDVPRPTNTELIAQLAERIRMKRF